MQPGSSIMPGKVNPVIPEVVNQIAFKVIGNDLTVTMAAEAGQLELNVMEPVIAEMHLRIDRDAQERHGHTQVPVHRRHHGQSSADAGPWWNGASAW